ncbi:hypothetical protein [Tardiphaga robiniae]|uniref:Uncharacterized protein n=1 Tax=Tardiphaga robiniae TaxID=943830 RepID=A0A7G6U832_9BRAD|nr:hypothetical protein [Tardiphaga robiniae]QND75164.1 hypothetical protein HB776_31095 [Tardiphaga robiniae]
MASAIELIVSAYVRVGDRDALVGLLDHRKRIATDLRSRTDFDFRVPLDAVENEIEVIEAGVATFDNSPS